jgi:hypothetical protein
VVFDSLFTGLIHDTYHDVAEDAELEKVAQLHSQVESLQNILLA